MLAELSTVIALACADFKNVNQTACQRAAEAYLVELKVPDGVDKLRNYVERKVSKQADPVILTTVGIGAKYAATKTLQYKTRSFHGLSLGINKTRDDFKQSLEASVTDYVSVGTEVGKTEHSYITKFHIGF